VVWNGEADEAWMVGRDLVGTGTAGAITQRVKMTTRFTKEDRQQIIKDFCLRRNADFDARLFEQEVREKGSEHPAYSWFEWNEDKAAEEYRIWQARQFATGLRISFKVEEIGRGGTVTVRSVEAPMLVSLGADRRDGGGYFLTDLDNPEHMAELCRQAAVALGTWLRRYEAALQHAGVAKQTFERQVKLLEKAAAPQKAEKAA
jgi:hypothetical protein